MANTACPVCFLLMLMVGLPLSTSAPTPSSSPAIDPKQDKMLDADWPTHDNTAFVRPPQPHQHRVHRRTSQRENGAAPNVAKPHGRVLGRNTSGAPFCLRAFATGNNVGGTVRLLGVQPKPAATVNHDDYRYVRVHLKILPAVLRFIETQKKLLGGEVNNR